MDYELEKSELRVIECLIEYSVEFLVVGGAAVQFYCPTRKRKDVDIWISNNSTNLSNPKKSIESAVGYPIPKLTVEALSRPNIHFPLKGLGHNFDFLTSLPAVGEGFKESYKKKRILKVEGLSIPILDKENLILSKLHTNSQSDLKDVALLQTYA